jgi:hypothetical protein
MTREASTSFRDRIAEDRSDSSAAYRQKPAVLHTAW